MRVAVLSDVHSNLAALEAVIADFGDVDEVWCAGDVVGYGPDPDECIRRLRQFRLHCVAGNHDWAAVGKVPVDSFNRDARLAAEWTARVLSAVSRDFILNLPLRIEREGYTLVHGSPRDPIFEYVLRPWQAAQCFAHFQTHTCLIGHSHLPLIFEQQDDGARYVDPDYGETLRLGEPRRIVNPGGVGQPRDGDPRASYALLNTDSAVLQFRRVLYDVGKTQARMTEVGLPPRLAQRLSYGR